MKPTITNCRWQQWVACTPYPGNFKVSISCSPDLTTKGQLISKGFFDILHSSKKKPKKFDPTTIIPQVNCFRSFFGRIEDTKRHFEINWPLIPKLTNLNFDYLFSDLFNYWEQHSKIILYGNLWFPFWNRQTLPSSAWF